MSFVIFHLPDTSLDLDPTYQLGHGPSWQVRAHEIFDHADTPTDRYMIRQMSAPANMLAAAAVLRRASQLEHPRLWGPQHWLRRDKQLWLATLRPGGEPLALVVSELRERGWASVVALWRPLVEALARAHSRGIIHGQLSPWTVWYNREAEQLCAIDAGCWIGDTTPDPRAEAWWAPELRLAPAQRHATPLADMWGAARLLMYMLFPEEEALADLPDLSGIPAFAAPTMARALALDPSRRPAQIEELLSATAPSLLEAYDGQEPGAEAQITSVHGARISHLERLEHPKLGPGIKFFLHQHGEEGEGERKQGAFFYEGADPNVYDSVRWAWEGAQLHLLDAREVTDSKGRTFITSAEETLPVLEPTFPISVSDVLKAERCTSRFLVDERDAGETSRALVLGNLVHGLLADLTAAEPIDFATSFAARARALRLDMLAAGMGDKELETMERDAHQHYDNLEQFTTGARADAQEAMAGLLRVRDESSSVYNDGAASWSGRHIEVTRYSPLYGLEGRIDLATEHAQEGVQIIELKSGSAWDGHLSQVRCYTLLWDGMAQTRGLKTRGYVLYSRYGRLTAAPTDDIRRERRILRARNELVACHRSSVDPSYEYTPPHFMQVPRNCQAPSCKFRRDRCQAQTEVLGLMPDATPDRAARPGGPWQGVSPALVEQAWRYWRHFSRLVAAERWNQNASLGAIFEPGRLAERVQSHRAIEQARLTRVDLGSNLITFEARGAQVMTAGSSVLAHRGDLHRGHTLQGSVVESSPTHVIIRSLGAQIAATLESDGWVLDHLPTRIGIRQAQRSLYQLMTQRDEALLRVLLEPGSEDARALMRAPEDAVNERAYPAQHAPRPRSRVTPALNDTQAEALHAAIHAPRGALIQGPPGTGKTTVIAQIVRELVARGQRVLVTAQTNTAVDTILAKVLDAGVRTFLRVGHESRSGELASLIATEGANPSLFFTESLAQQAGSLRELANALKESPVFGCTTHAAAGASALEYLRREYPSPIFDVVIVDEASQLTEPLVLGSLCLGKRFVLVGDHLQLPPIVESPQALSVFLDPQALHMRYAADEQPDDQWPDALDQAILPGGSAVKTFSLPEELRKIGVAGLDRSLFERLVTRLPHVMLEEQYRMNASIMAFSNREFYGGRLRAHADVAEHTLRFAPNYLEAQPPAMRSILDADAPVVFVNVDGTDDARTNRAEATALVDTLLPLLNPEAFLHGGPHGPRPSVGVISPFRAQVQLIRELLYERLGAAAQRVEVDTVERYQGGERDIILVSLVKTERAGEFLADTRRLNVTLTRARKKLIVFGHKPCLSLSPLYRLLIEQPDTRVVDHQPPAAPV